MTTDALAAIRAELDQRAADGLKVITLDAVYRLLPDPELPEARHEIVFGDHGWNLSHPKDCDSATCWVYQAADRSLARSPYAPGRYTVWLNGAGHLYYKEVTP